MPPERRAALLLLGLAVAGQAVRSWLLAPGSPPGEVRLSRSGPPASPSAHRDSAMRLARPLAPGERVDLDRASALEIARLPRVGLALAKAIVADRTAHGPFGSLAAVDRVPGIGPGLLGAIKDQVTFSAPAAPGTLGPLGGTAPASRGLPLDLNSATAAQLEALPFIGPSMAQRIVAWREKRGPFLAVDSLVRVPGVGPATVARVRDRLMVR